MFKLVLQVLHCQSHHTVHGHLIPHCPRLLFTFWQRRKSKLSSPKEKLADFRIKNYTHILEEFNIYLLFLADKLMTLFLILWSEKQMTSEFQECEQNSDQKSSWSQLLFSGRKPTTHIVEEFGVNLLFWQKDWTDKTRFWLLRKTDDVRISRMWTDLTRIKHLKSSIDCNWLLKLTNFE